MCRITTLSIATLLVSGTLFAYDYESALNNFAHEMAHCAAYYKVMSVCIENRDPEEPSIETSRMASTELLNRSSMLTDRELTEARYELGVKSINEEIANDCGRASIAINKYALDCKTVFDRPDERMKYWESVE